MNEKWGGREREGWCVGVGEVVTCGPGAGNTTNAWDRCRYVLSDSPPNVSDSPFACLTDRLFVQGFLLTLRRDGGHSVSVRVDQDYPKSVRCLDGRSSGDVGRSGKIGGARFWVGVGTS